MERHDRLQRWDGICTETMAGRRQRWEVSARSHQEYGES